MEAASKMVAVAKQVESQIRMDVGDNISSIDDEARNWTRISGERGTIIKLTRYTLSRCNDKKQDIVHRETPMTVLIVLNRVQLWISRVDKRPLPLSSFRCTVVT